MYVKSLAQCLACRSCLGNTGGRYCSSHTPDFPSTVALFLLFHLAACLFPIFTPLRGSRDACSAGDPALMPEGQALQTQGGPEPPAVLQHDGTAWCPCEKLYSSV